MKRIILSVTNDLCGDRRLLKMALSLHKNGYEVLLLGRKQKRTQRLQAPFSYKRMSLIFNRSVWFYAEFNLRLFFFLLFSKVDIMLSNDTDTLVANYLASKIRGKKLVFDAHECFPELPELALRPKVKRIWERIEAWIFPKLTHCYTVCQSIADYYNKKYKIEMKVVRNMPSFAESQKQKAESKTNSGKKLLDYHGKKIILYQGAVNIGRGLEWIIDAMPLIENAVLVIIGDGDIMQNLKKRVNHHKLNDKVFFLGRISGADLHKYTPSADIGLCLLENRGLNYYYSLPNRIFDYLHAGVPLLATNFPEISNIVGNYKTGILVNHYEPEYLAKIINNFFKIGFDTTHFDETAKQFCWENEEKIMLGIID